MHVHDFTAAFSVGHADLNFTVKTARATKRWVERISSVGGTDDDDVVSSLHPVHQGQHLGDHATLNLARHVFTLRTDGIDFIDEDNGWCVVGSLVEDFAELLLRFTVVL